MDCGVQQQVPSAHLHTVHGQLQVLVARNIRRVQLGNGGLPRKERGHVDVGRDQLPDDCIVGEDVVGVQAGRRHRAFDDLLSGIDAQIRHVVVYDLFERGGDIAGRIHAQRVEMAVRALYDQFSDRQTDHVGLGDRKAGDVQFAAHALGDDRRAGHKILDLRKADVGALDADIHQPRHLSLQIRDLCRVNLRVVDLCLCDLGDLRRQRIDLRPLDVGFFDVRRRDLRFGDAGDLRLQRGDGRPVDVRLGDLGCRDLRCRQRGKIRIQLVGGDAARHQLVDVGAHGGDGVRHQLLDGRGGNLGVLDGRVAQLCSGHGIVDQLCAGRGALGQIVAVNGRLQFGDLTQGDRRIVRIRAGRLKDVSGHAHAGADVRPAADHMHDVVQVDRLKVSVLRVLHRVFQLHEVHVQTHHRAVRAIGKVCSGQLPQLCTGGCDGRNAIRAHLHVILDLLGSDHGNLRRPRALHIGRAVQHQTAAVLVLAHGDNARQHAGRVFIGHRAQHVLSVAHLRAQIALCVVEDVDVKVVADQLAADLLHHAAVAPQGCRDALARPVSGDGLFAVAVHGERMLVVCLRKDALHGLVCRDIVQLQFTADGVSGKVVADVQRLDADQLRRVVLFRTGDAEQLLAGLLRLNHLSGAAGAGHGLRLGADVFQIVRPHVAGCAALADHHAGPVSGHAQPHHLGAGLVHGDDLRRKAALLAQVQPLSGRRVHPVDLPGDRLAGRFLLHHKGRHLAHGRGRLDDVVLLKIVPAALLVHRVGEGQLVHSAGMLLNGRFRLRQRAVAQRRKIVRIGRMYRNHRSLHLISTVISLTFPVNVR